MFIRPMLRGRYSWYFCPSTERTTAPGAHQSAVLPTWATPAHSTIRRAPPRAWDCLV